MTAIAQGTGRSWLQRLATWWEDWDPGSLAAKVGRAEVAKIAADVGLTVADLENVNRAGKGGADPMPQRLASLDLKATEIVQRDPAVMRDLQRVCALCTDKTHCKDELKHEPAGKAWQSYCPNMQTFDALTAERNRLKH